MYREFCRCPYCGEGAVGVEDSEPAIIFDPSQGTGHGPCPHLAYVSCVLSVSQAGANPTPDLPERSGNWFWAFGDEGVQPYPAKGSPRKHYADHVVDLGYEITPDEYVPSQTPYQVVGGTYSERDAARPGSGTFDMGMYGGEHLVGTLEGWGIYSPNPECLAREVCSLAGFGV